MATSYLVNNVRVGTRWHFAGELLDDTVEDLGPLIASGGFLVPSTNAAAAFAAVIAQKIRKGGGDPTESESVMLGALVAVNNPGERFAFGPSTPTTNVLTAITPDQILYHGAIIITTPFNGAGATASIGTSSDLGQVLDRVPLTVNATYDQSHSLIFVQPDNFILTLNLAGSTVGAGHLFYEIG